MTDEGRDLASYLRAMMAASEQVDVQRDPEQLRAQSAGLTAKLSELAGRTFTGIPDDEEDDRARGDSEARFDREVRVVAEVDGRGRLVNLEISPFAMRELETDDLATACTEAIRRARVEAAEQIEAVLAELRPAVDLPPRPEISLDDIEELFTAAREVSEEWTSRSRQIPGH